MNNIFSDYICIWVVYYQVLIQILTVYLFFYLNMLLLFGDSIKSFGDSVRSFGDSVRSFGTALDPLGTALDPNCSPIVPS